MKQFPRALLLTAMIAVLPIQLFASTILKNDFNTASSAWPDAEAKSTSRAVSAAIVHGEGGTIDAANSTQASGALRLTVHAEAAKGGAWGAAIVSSLLPVSTTETNLGKLTLSFDHSVSSARPVTVQIESFDAKRKRTGGREGVVYPAAPDFYLRSALELSTLRPFGTGAFQPTNPYIRLTFKINNLSAEEKTALAELRIDNVAYASPAYYVSPAGSDSNDGRTETAAFATPQKAVEAAQPGDIILLMEGTYHGAAFEYGSVGFTRAGEPAAWIVVKNYPGHHPVLKSDGWNAVKVGRGSKTTPSKEPALAYLEIRGLHIQGKALDAKEKFPQDIGKVLPSTNGNGISIDGRFETNVPHHIRIADNIVENCCGGGISALESDWTTVENNTSRDNCWWMIYAGSGISFLTRSNFDAADNIYKDLIRNNVVSGNRCFVPWVQVKKISDGNGIIIDSNYEPKDNKIHRGRTLVQNNLTYNNGGSGIHAFHSHRVDIINNTAYYNGASPELNWGQIFVQVSDDVRIMNNILVSRPGQPINSIGPDSGDQKSVNVTRAGNIYYGGLAPKLTGDNDVVADPLFVNAGTEYKTADFHLRPDSPARGKGMLVPLAPLLDLEGNSRKNPPSRGAYEK